MREIRQMGVRSPHRALHRARQSTSFALRLRPLTPALARFVIFVGSKTFLKSGDPKQLSARMQDSTRKVPHRTRSERPRPRYWVGRAFANTVGHSAESGQAHREPISMRMNIQMPRTCCY